MATHRYTLYTLRALPTHVRQGFFAGQGGVILNAGDIVVGSTSSFTENTAAVSDIAVSCTPLHSSRECTWPYYVDNHGHIQSPCIVESGHHQIYHPRGSRVDASGVVNKINSICNALEDMSSSIIL